MKTLNMAVRWDHDIDRACRAASDLARSKKCGVRFNFNEVSLLATPKKSPVTIAWEYAQITGQLARRYRLSPEGQKKRARNEAEVKLAQSAVDSWMLILPNMLESGLDNTIGWLSNFLPVADRVGVKVNHAMLISQFEAHGYKANDCAGEDEAFYEEKENLGRYIVGNVLVFWKCSGAVHPGICDLCARYDVLCRNLKN